MPSELLPPARPEIGVANAPAARSPKAVVITHGWNADASDWVAEMGRDLCLKLGAANGFPAPGTNALTAMCQAGGWDVWVQDCKAKADTGLTNPMQAYVNAWDVGQGLASQIKGWGYQHIHFIAHSAGANLIDGASVWLKTWAQLEDRQAPEIHQTFLDAYDPRKETSPYGAYADWADNYVDTRDAFIPSDLDATKLFLAKAFSIDVTPAYDGCLSLVEPDRWICRHSRPYRFYGISIDPSFVGVDRYWLFDPIGSTPGSTAGMGYPLSLESGLSLSGLMAAYKPGSLCVVGGSVCYADALPPSFWHFFPGALADTTVDVVQGTVAVIAGTGQALLDSVKLGVDWATGLLTTQTRATAVSAAETGEAPSWVVLYTTTSVPANTLSFSWHFASAGEGFVRIFVDDVQVAEIDQRSVSEVSPAPQTIFVGDLAPGRHKIAFRLDGFGANPSGVELTGVLFGQTALFCQECLPNRGGWRAILQ